MKETISVLPPLINQCFNKNLLSIAVELRFKKERLYEMYLYLKKECIRKGMNQSTSFKKRENWKKLLKTFEEIYGWIEKEEKNQEPKRNTRLKNPSILLPIMIETSRIFLNDLKTEPFYFPNQGNTINFKKFIEEND